MEDSRILVKLRGGNSSFRELFPANNVPDIGMEMPIGIETAVEYNPTEFLESKDQLFYVQLDPEQHDKMIGPYLDALGLGTDIVAQPEYADVNIIFKAVGRKILFTRVSSSARIHENGKCLLKFGEDGVEVDNISFAVECSGQVDAYFDGGNRIYFANFAKAKPFFKSFSEFFQDAWYDSNDAFLASNLFAVSEIAPDDVGPTETRMISEIRANASLNLSDAAIVGRIKEYAKRYPLAGVAIYSDGRIRISSKEDLKCVTKLLTERYYTSEITGELIEAKNMSRMKEQSKKEPTFTQKTAEDAGDIVAA